MDRPLEVLINEVRLLYQSVVQIADEIHGDSNISLGMRAVLEYLGRNGSATVPHMAKERRVSRQRIQTLVNSLLELEMVKSIDNPASKRSPLIALTPVGAGTILDMRRLEGQAMRVDIDDGKLVHAAETLAELRLGLEEAHRKVKSLS